MASLGEFDARDDDDETESLPEPIYLRLDNKLLEYRDSYYQSESEDSGDDVSEDQVGLDLTAPPPES